MVKRSGTIIEGGVRKDVYRLEDIPNLVRSFANKITLKRYKKARPLLSQMLKREANYLFKYMVDDLGVIDSSWNPFHFYYTKSWPELNKAYAKRKKSDRFWKYKGLLGSWFQTASPTEIFGDPFVDLRNYTLFANGYQNATFLINPFPRSLIRVTKNFPRQIGYELFGNRRDGKGFSSNEDERPIIRPAMLMITRYRINSKAKKLIKEVMENG